MTKSKKRTPVGTVLTGRWGHVLRPDELGVAVSPQSRFAKQSTLGFALHIDEFNEVDKGPINYSTARVRVGTVLFAMVYAETSGYAHIGLMDVSHPGSYEAVMESAMTCTVNVAATNGQGDILLVSLDVDDAFAAVIEEIDGPRQPSSHIHLLDAFRFVVRHATDGSLLKRLGWGAVKKRASVHLLLPEANRASMAAEAPVTPSAGSMQ